MQVRMRHILPKVGVVPRAAWLVALATTAATSARADDAPVPLTLWPRTQIAWSAATTAVVPPQDEPLWEPPIAHTLVLLSVIRGVESVLYPVPFAQARDVGVHYREAFTRPPLFDPDARPFEWDHDPWTINVVGHGLLGSELYLRARSCHFGPLGSLAFAAASSAAWEYGFEGNGVRPSALDLVYTPLAGMALGEGRHQLVRLARSLRSRGARDVLLVLLDPLGESERQALGWPC